MTEPTAHRNAPEPTSDIKSVSGRASWGGSVASAEPAPKGAGEDLHRGAQVHLASTEGGSKPEQKEKQSEPRSRRDRAARARQRPRQPPERKRLHQPNTRFNEEEFTLIKSAAARCNVSVAGFLARSALAAARDLDRTSAEIADEREVITALFDSRRRLGWAGSNLNQAMKALNSGADAPQLEAAVAAVQQAAGTVHAAASQLIAHRSS
ncbi:hypothetical protein ACFXOM_34040 [Streptomyces sp. NPDC059169]|uniref:hypothetical protein n=1 Tax=Streptomyces sp. NPDC059169 TaxID=3346754 RepID=UPI0036C5AE10